MYYNVLYDVILRNYYYSIHSEVETQKTVKYIISFLTLV